MRILWIVSLGANSRPLDPEIQNEIRIQTIQWQSGFVRQLLKVTALNTLVLPPYTVRPSKKDQKAYEKALYGKCVWLESQAALETAIKKHSANTDVVIYSTTQTPLLRFEHFENAVSTHPVSVYCDDKSPALLAAAPSEFWENFNGKTGPGDYSSEELPSLHGDYGSIARIIRCIDRSQYKEDYEPVLVFFKSLFERLNRRA